MCRTMMYFLLFVAMTPALAVPVYMEFQGEIREQHYDPAIGESIPVGSQFEGHLCYDTEIVSQSQHIPGNSSYVLEDAAELVFSVNGFIFTSDRIAIALTHYNDLVQDNIRISTLEYTSYEGIDWLVSLSFSNSSENVLDATNLPTEHLKSSDWPGAYMNIVDHDTPGIHIPNIMGCVTSITPEPASLALLALGGLAVVRRR